jgi:hypothetical protein
MQPRSLSTRPYTSTRCYITNSCVGKSVHLLLGQTTYLCWFCVKSAHSQQLNRILTFFPKLSSILLFRTKSYTQNSETIPLIWKAKSCLYLAMKNTGRVGTTLCIPNLSSRWLLQTSPVTGTYSEYYFVKNANRQVHFATSPIFPLLFTKHEIIHYRSVNSFLLDKRQYNFKVENIFISWADMLRCSRA